jgi:hypothetical protein
VGSYRTAWVRLDGVGHFDNQPDMLDQFFINKNMATGDAPIRSTQRLCKSSSCRPWSIQVSIRSQSHQGGVAPSGSSPACQPRPQPAVGGMGKPVNQTGFSDHFPITMTVTEVD